MASLTDHASELRTVEVAGVGFRYSTRVLMLVLLAFLASILLAAWALTLGSYPLSLSEVLAALTRQGSDKAEFIVMDLRLPRVLVAVMVGAMLAQSGAIFQGLVRNPLVSPDIIGINAGAVFAAVWWIFSQRDPALLPFIALLGAIAAAVAIYLLSWRNNLSPARLVLVGIGINAMLTAGTTLLVIRAEIYDASRAILWMTGSVYQSNFGDVLLLAIALAVLLPAGAILMWSLRVLQVGDFTAKSVGMRVERARLLLIVVGCALSALAVSVAGPIGFVALMVPHLARLLAGPMSGGVFLFTGALGALLVQASDMVGQHLLPVALPAGVLTAVVGAPYFLYLLYQANAEG